MADILENTPEPQEQIQPPEVSPIEQKALDMGWRPKEQFEGAEEDFIDAKEFVRRKPLFDKIEQQSKEVKALRRTLEEFKEHYTKVEEAQYKKALQALKEQRKEALREGDADRFDVLDDKIKEAEQEVAELRSVQTRAPAQAEEHPEFANWKRVNTWYANDPEMRDFADAYGTTLARKGEEPSRVLAKVSEAVRKQFPDKFVNPRKQTAVDVEVSKGRSTTSNTAGYLLSETERKIMNDFVRSGVMTKEEYIASLKQMEGKA